MRAAATVASVWLPTNQKRRLGEEGTWEKRRQTIAALSPLLPPSSPLHSTRSSVVSSRISFLLSFAKHTPEGSSCRVHSHDSIQINLKSAPKLFSFLSTQLKDFFLILTFLFILFQSRILGRQLNELVRRFEYWGLLSLAGTAGSALDMSLLCKRTANNMWRGNHSFDVLLSSSSRSPMQQCALTRFNDRLACSSGYERLDERSSGNFCFVSIFCA